MFAYRAHSGRVTDLRTTLPEVEPSGHRSRPVSLSKVRYPIELIYMGGTAGIDYADSLVGWLYCSPDHPRARGDRPPDGIGPLRFAFYGRISTQDAASSEAWQLVSAQQAIAGRGRIVVEYFDVGCSRRMPWVERPQAAALLAALTSRDRVFDAVVVGEYERAFYGDQLVHLATVMAAYGVELWLPETFGPVDLHDPSHQAFGYAARSPVTAGGATVAVSHDGGDAGAGARSGPPSGWPPAVRLPPG